MITFKRFGTYMKNVLKSVLLYLVFVMGCSNVFAIPLWMHGDGQGQKSMLSSDFYRLFSPNSAESSAGYYAKRVVKALFRGRKRTMREAFSLNTLKSTPDLQDQIDYVFSLYEGEFLYWGELGFSSESSTGMGLSHRTTCKGYYTIKTDKAEYEMFIMCYKRNEVELDDIGIISMRFYRVNDIETMTEPVGYRMDNGVVEMINERDNAYDFSYPPGIFIPSTRSDDAEKSREQMNSILDCVKNRNESALLSKFCRVATEKWENKSQEMQELFDFVKGDIVSCEAVSIMRDTAYVDDVAFSPLFQVYNVETTAGEYVFYVNNIEADYDNGIYTIRVIDANHREDLYTTWTRMRPGAYVPVGYYDKEYR